MYIEPLYINEVRGDFFRSVSSLISQEKLGAVIRFQRFLPGRRVSPALQGYTLGPARQAYRWFPGAMQEIEAVSATGRTGGRWRGVCAPPQCSLGQIFSFSVGCLRGLRGPSALAKVSHKVRLGYKGCRNFASPTSSCVLCVSDGKWGSDFIEEIDESDIVVWILEQKACSYLKTS